MLHVLDRHTVGQILRTKHIDAWGVAANEPRLPRSPDHPTAVSMLMRIDPLVVRGLRHGPTYDYQQEYWRLNSALDDAADTLVDVFHAHGHAGEAVPATVRETNGDSPFPHKSAATSAGLGWIGKTALFVTPEFGPAVRLATVFTDLALPRGEPTRESGCAACRDCVDACPAGCGRDVLWRPDVPRELLFDAGACRRHMELLTDLEEQICGVCIAACPLSLRY